VSAGGPIHRTLGETIRSGCAVQSGQDISR
jgi:hypothetical protein